MNRRPMLGIVAAVVALGLLGAATYAFAWDPDPTFQPAPDVAAAQVTAAEVEQAAGLRVFFGHKSVGNNIISGLGAVSAAKGVEGPNLREIAVGDAAQLGDGGTFLHAPIGENGHPYWKLENYESMLRGGLAEQVDVAMVKFCYVDVRWDTDVDKLFQTYRDTMAGLATDYPDVRFVHFTVPLTTGPYGIKDHIKQFIGRDDNGARERYNALMRAEYADNLFDIAALESSAPDAREGQLYGGYSSDGAHLNETGSALVAVELIRLLNNTGA